MSGTDVATAASVEKASWPTVSAVQNDEKPSSEARRATSIPVGSPSGAKLAKVTPGGVAAVLTARDRSARLAHRGRWDG
jgi:hypothetical protein